MAPTMRLLVRIMICKVESMRGLRSVFEHTPTRPNDEGWNCVVWVKDALANVEKNGKALGTSVTNWEQIRDKAMEYCQQKTDERRFSSGGSYNSRQAPTWDLLQDRELMP
ncbi:hypothetical protein F5B20DRAFT_576193 [Whalleya microplaca]|nr:hypothetical protein F5B20DRAFT_576193 [Whalleya microplaca]